MSTFENNKRIAKNTLLLYIRMLLTMGVSLYTSRVVLNALGIEDFGLYNVIGGVIVLFSFLNSSMTSATQRFLNFEMGKNNFSKLQQVFSASINIHIFIAVVVVVLSETIGLWFVNSQLNIPNDRTVAANWVYQFTILTFVINVIKVPYNATIIAHERMNFYAYISIVEITLKLAIVFLLTFINCDKLILYSVLFCGVTFIIFCVFVFYCLRQFRSSRYVRLWNLTLYKQLLSFSGWSIFGSIANVGKTQGINILINIFCGVAVNAAISVSNQVVQALNRFVSNFQVAFNPQIVKLYAADEQKDLFKLIYRTSKYSFFLLFVLSLPVLLHTQSILDIWLKNVPQYAANFCQLTIVYMLLETISGPLWMTVQATGEIKKYQMVISFILLLNLPFAFLILKYTSLEPYWVIVGNIIFSIVSLFYRIVYLYRAIRLSIIEFFKNVISKLVIIVLLGFFFSSYISNLCNQSGYIGLFVSIIITVIIGCFWVFLIGMDKNEKLIIKTYIKNLIKHVLFKKSI